MSVAVNVADSEPAGIVTDAGSASSEVLPEANEITVVVADVPPIVTRARHRLAFPTRGGQGPRQACGRCPDGHRTRATDPIVHRRR